MLRWLNRLIWFLPSGAASASALGILIGVVAFFAWLSMQPGFAFGRITGIDLAQGGRELVEVNPWPFEWPTVKGAGQPDLVLLDQQGIHETGIQEGSWLLAYGDQRLTSYRILGAQRFATLPAGTALPTVKGLLLLPGELPLAALIVGGLLVVAGRSVMRLLAALVLSLAAAALIWHGVLVADFTGAIELPRAALYPLTTIGLVFGAATALRARHDLLQKSLERSLVVILLVAFLPEITAFFAWPEEPSVILAVMLTLLTPLVGYATMGAYWLSLGLAASPQAGYVILALSVLVTLVLQADAGPKAPERIMTKLAAHRDPQSGRIPLRTLFS